MVVIVVVVPVKIVVVAAGLSTMLIVGVAPVKVSLEPALVAIGVSLVASYGVPSVPVAAAVVITNLPTVGLFCKKRRLVCTKSDAIVLNCGSNWASRD